MILVGLLGMNASTAFPIMMGSCAFLMPVASVRFLKVPSSFESKAVLGMAIAAVPAVFVAWKFFSGLNMTAVKWLVADHTVWDVDTATGANAPWPSPIHAKSGGAPAPTYAVCMRMSSLPSPLNSPTATKSGFGPALNVRAGAKVGAGQTSALVGRTEPR
jgi:hypothetical protein